MTDTTTAWQEIKGSVGVLLKVIGYSALTLGICYGAGYVYFYCL